MPNFYANFFVVLKSIKNDDLDNLMEKSATNQLAEDGLSSLKYKKIEEKNFPLYSWIKVQVPKGCYVCEAQSYKSFRRLLRRPTSLI